MSSQNRVDPIEIRPESGLGGRWPMRWRPGTSVEGGSRFWPSGFRVYPILAIAHNFLKNKPNIIKVAGNYPAFCGTHIPTLTLHPPQHLLASPSSTCQPPQPMDPLKRFPAKNTKSTETADTTTLSSCRGAYEQRSVVITGAGAYTTSRGSS